MTDIDLIKKRNKPSELLRLANGEAPQYIIGYVNFYGYQFKVNKAVLIPRFETEGLIAKTLPLLNNHMKILDIGTGSGAIAITLSKKLGMMIDACDLSKPALRVAKINAKQNQAQVNFIYSNLFSNIHDRYDCLISNPPYLSEDAIIDPIVKNNEPALALYAKDHGLAFYKAIINQSDQYLKPYFIMAFEIGFDEGEAVLKIAQAKYPKAKSYIEKDLANYDRYLFIVNI